jgi:pimeloyl-ACP methyl ester carboxylesterase
MLPNTRTHLAHILCAAAVTAMATVPAGAAEKATPKQPVDDNNYMVGDKTGTAPKKAGDKRFMPDLTGKDIKVSDKNQYSPGRDLVYYESTRTNGLELAMLVTKPAKPSHILAGTHGWHGDIGGFSYLEKPTANYLRIAVDMRGRKFSEGKPDCNGWELYDVIDAIDYAKVFYRELVSDSDVIYFEAGSGGGGNAYTIIGKFPDFFAACTAQCGISDYALWYRNDTVGEFRDEMDPWVGCSPDQNPMAYRARSGLNLIENLCTPLYIVHGETDVRVPVEHARLYVARAKELGKESLVTYRELPNVGTNAHWGRATKEQIAQFGRESEQNRARHTTPVTIPRRGRMVVGGYLVTKAFSVVLDSVDKTAVIDYDLDKNEFKVTCDGPGTYQLKKFPPAP